MGALLSCCNAVADHLHTVLKQRNYSVQVLVGTPAAAAPSAANAQHRVNLFFYRFEPSSFGMDAGPGEPWFIRAYCLITAFCVDQDRIEAGKHDLRVLGEVIQIFHETPVLRAVKADGLTVKLQMIFSPIGLDDINRLWSLQKDVVYRPSIAYEVAVVPVVPKERDRGSPMTGALSVSIHGRMDGDLGPDGAPKPPPFEPQEIDTQREDWAPQIAFQQQGVLAQSIVIPRPSTGVQTLPVILAGHVGAKVTLWWDVWDRNAGWRASAVSKTVDIPLARIDPDNVPAAAIQKVQFPSEQGITQAVLYAVRTYPRAVDGARVEVRSNPLLVTIVQKGNP